MYLENLQQGITTVLLTIPTFIFGCLFIIGVIIIACKVSRF